MIDWWGRTYDVVVYGAILSFGTIALMAMLYASARIAVRLVDSWLGKP